MRLSNVVLVLALGGIAALSTTAGCGGDTVSGGGGSSSSSSSGTSSSSAMALPCDPTDAVCKVAKSSCIGLVENKDKEDFTLRMAQLGVTAPTNLAMGLVGMVVGSGVKMNLGKCNLDGNGTFNLLLEFNKTTKKLKAGGAKPNPDPTKGYSFLTGTIKGQVVTPLEVAVDIKDDGTFTPMAGADVVLPIYLGLTDPEPSVFLPIHQALISGKLSDNNNCIGSYDAANQDPMNDCKGAAPFKTGADLDGFITLEEADTVIVDALKQSLCVIIAGNTFGDGAMPASKCKRTAGAIDFKGDWCKTGNVAASDTCFDSMKLRGTLAASSVQLNP
jgi:hypothetical protein